jgi:hypothetical protein
MVKIVSSISDIHDSNAVCVISTLSDIELLSVLKLDQNIIKKVRQSYKSKKDSCLHFFLGRKNFEGLYILVTQKKDIKPFTEFLGQHFSQLPKKYTLFLLQPKIATTIVDTCLLRRYSFQEFQSSKKLDTCHIYI